MPYLPIGFERAGEVLRRTEPDLIVSKQKLRKAGAIQLVRERRETANQNLDSLRDPLFSAGCPFDSRRKDL